MGIMLNNELRLLWMATPTNATHVQQWDKYIENMGTI